MFKLHFYLYRIEVVVHRYIQTVRKQEAHYNFRSVMGGEGGWGVGSDLVTQLPNVINVSDKSETGYSCSSGYTWGG